MVSGVFLFGAEFADPTFHFGGKLACARQCDRRLAGSLRLTENAERSTSNSERPIQSVWTLSGRSSFAARAAIPLSPALVIGAWSFSGAWDLLIQQVE